MDNVIRLHGDTAADPDAVAIGELYTKGKRGVIEIVYAWIEAGQRLDTKQQELNRSGRGKWLPWLAANRTVLDFGEDTAQRLIKFYHTALTRYSTATPELTEVEATELLGRLWNNEGRGGGGAPKPYKGDNEWYTPEQYIGLVRRVLGGIDLDPASNEHAQKVVKAKSYYTKEDDALTQEWRGRVWLNPPYSKGVLAQFVEKMIHEVEAENVTSGIMLLNNFTDADWFQNACSICDAICFPRGRIYFENASGKIDRPLNGQVFFYYGTKVDSFSSAFSSLGCGFVGAGAWRRSAH